jgi:heterodisulfide reductase subunit A2
LHPLAYEVANVREQAAFVHGTPEAKVKAETLMRIAIEKARLWTEPPFDMEMPVAKDVAVIGGGLMAVLVAKELLSQGLVVHLVEVGKDRIDPPYYIFRSQEERESALLLVEGTSMYQMLRRYGPSRILDIQGLPGDYGLILEAGGEMVPLRCGAIVLAPEPRSELRGLDGSPALPAAGLAKQGRRIVILPSGASSGVGCSCITPRGILYAILLKNVIPELEITLFGREMRAMGGLEKHQRAAQEMGIRFIRIDSEPSVEGRDPYVISWRDGLAGEMRLEADTVLLDTVLTPEAKTLAQVFELPLDEKGEILGLDSRLNPGETVRKGVFATRYRISNMLYEDMVVEAGAVAARASEFVGRGKIEVGGAVAEVDQEKCSACLSCLRLCPYSAPVIGQAGKAEVRIELCQGCGSCVALCPSRAIDLYSFSDAQMVAQAKVALWRER